MTQTSGPPYRDYLRAHQRTVLTPAVVLHAPQPGSGTVFVRLDGDDSHASWQDGPEECVDIDGDEATVLAWARSRPAARRLTFSLDFDDYVPLD